MYQARYYCSMLQATTTLLSQALPLLLPLQPQGTPQDQEQRKRSQRRDSTKAKRKFAVRKY